MTTWIRLEVLFVCVHCLSINVKPNRYVELWIYWMRMRPVNGWIPILWESTLIQIYSTTIAVLFVRSNRFLCVYNMIFVWEFVWNSDSECAYLHILLSPLFAHCPTQCLCSNDRICIATFLLCENLILIELISIDGRPDGWASNQGNALNYDLNSIGIGKNK